jgi:hypothetical protein
MSQTKPSLARNVAGVVFTIIIGITFFFAIIGVFGLAAATGSLALAILLAGLIIKRAPVGEDLP